MTRETFSMGLCLPGMPFDVGTFVVFAPRVDIRIIEVDLTVRHHVGWRTVIKN